jgi:hypothetical protein
MGGRAPAHSSRRGLVGLDEPSLRFSERAGRGPIGINYEQGLASHFLYEALHPDVRPARQELVLLTKAYHGTLKAKGKSGKVFVDTGADGWLIDTTAYLEYRRKVFGSTQQYEAFKAKSIEELDADGGKLRDYVDPPAKDRSEIADWKQAQDTFYTWTRKAFHDKYGADKSFPKIIRAGKSKALKEGLQKVKAVYTKPMTMGGPVPRPMKEARTGHPWFYIIGSVSDHAVGTAVDVNDKTNAQIATKLWQSILAFTDKQANAKSLRRDWEANDVAKARKVYDTIKAINDAWVEKLAAAVKQHGSIDAAVKNEHKLKAIGLTFATERKDGFMDHEWELVRAFHEAGFTWGAVFEKPDLHHFEIEGVEP